MLNKNEILQFKKEDSNNIEKINELIKTKKFWLALSTINSLSKSSQSVDIDNILFDFHLQLPFCDLARDDALKLIFSPYLEIVIKGINYIINYLGFENKKKIYSFIDFFKYRLSKTKFSAKFDDSFFVEMLYGGFKFVEKEEENFEYIKKLEDDFERGEFSKLLFDYDVIPSNNAYIDYARKLVLDVYLKTNKIKQAEQIFNEIKEKDAYYYSLGALLFYKKKNSNKTNSLVEILKSEADKNLESLLLVLNSLILMKNFDDSYVLIKKYQKKYEFCANFYSYKWFIEYKNGCFADARNSLFRCFTLDEKKVLEYEIYLLLENNKKLNSYKFGDIPKTIMNSVNNRFKEILNTKFHEIKKFSKAKLKIALNWAELLCDYNMANIIVGRLLFCEQGFEIIKDKLISFSSPNWLKKICILQLVLTGVQNYKIWYIVDDCLISCTPKLPQIMNYEIEEKNKEANENFNSLILSCYAEAFAELAIKTTGFENRLLEVADIIFSGAFNWMNNNKNFDKKTLIGMFLLLTCSSYYDDCFFSPAVECSCFSTYENIANELGCLGDDIKNFIKTILS